MFKEVLLLLRVGEVFNKPMAPEKKKNGVLNPPMNVWTMKWLLIRCILISRLDMYCLQNIQWEETRGEASGQQEESSEEELPSSEFCFGPYFLTLYESGPHPGHDSWVSSCCFYCLRWGSNPVPLGGLTVPKVLMVPSNPAILSTRPWEQSGLVRAGARPK